MNIQNVNAMHLGKKTQFSTRFPAKNGFNLTTTAPSILTTPLKPKMEPKIQKKHGWFVEGITSSNRSIFKVPWLVLGNAQKSRVLKKHLIVQLMNDPNSSVEFLPAKTAKTDSLTASGNPWKWWEWKTIFRLPASFSGNLMAYFQKRGFRMLLMT